MANKFKAGDAVRWNTPQGETHGKIVRKLTGPTDVGGHHFTPSADNPEYLVRSDKSGAEAVHREESLHPAS